MFRLLSAVILLLASVAPAPGRAVSTQSSGVLWQYPQDLASRNLYYGPGGVRHQPRSAFNFLKEDLKGTNPKIVVRDSDGVVWGVKMGDEARPETVASRLVWAVGYFADENYFAGELRVHKLPERLRRGQQYIAPGGALRNVRLKRYSQGSERLAGEWQWRENPFAGTREFNGLRVLMALINNWDLTDENTSIHERTRGGEVIARYYIVGDLGSTFGSGDLTWPMHKARGNLDAYRSSRFIENLEPGYVDLHAPAGASAFFLFTPREFVHKRHLRWIGRRVPREDAKWIGQLLSRLSPDQLRDAFRAAGYGQSEVEGFARVVENRVRALAAL